MEGDALSCFSSLFDVLHVTLEDTTFISQFLYTRCTDYQALLKRWSVIEQEVEQCTCNPCYEEPEELVGDIIGVVEKARATRSHNSNRPVLNDCKSECSSYISKSTTSRSKPRQSLEKQSSINKTVSSIRNKHEKLEAKSSNAKLCTFTKLRTSHCFQTTYQKDFSSKKLSFKPQLNVKSNKVVVRHTKPSQILSEKSVEYLLKRVTSNASTSSSKVKPSSEFETKTVCKLHSSGGYISPLYKTLKEAINDHGVPSELLKLLLSFNQYCNLNDTKKGTPRKSGVSYLQKLNEMNEQNWTASEPIVNVFSQYINVLRNTLLWKRNDFNEKYFAELDENLSSLGKLYLKVFDMDMSPQNDTTPPKRKSIRETTEINEQIQRAAAGIWKRSYSVLGLESSLCLSYNSKQDCKDLQKKIQKIQKMYLQMDILFSLNEHVFPLVSSLDNEHVVLPQIYKTCWALCDILSLSFPVILKL